MAKARDVKRIASALLMSVLAVVLQILMFCPMASVDLPLSKAFDISWIGTYNLADNLHSLIHGVDAIERGAFWATAAVCVLEMAIVMIAVGGVQGLLSDNRSATTFGMVGGIMATVALTVAAYVIYDTVYPYTTINDTTRINATVWIMPWIALLAVLAAVLNRKCNKPE